MSRFFPLGILKPIEQALPVGILPFQIDTVEEGMTEVWALAVTLHVQDLVPFSDLPYTHTFEIGSKEDPTAEEVQTMRVGSKAFAEFCEKVGVDIEGQPLEAVSAMLAGKILLGETKKPKKGDVRVETWFKEGEKEVHVAKAEPLPPPPAPPMRRISR